MSTIVCQGLQSCLEPRLVEPLVFKHIPSPPKSSPRAHTEEEKKVKTNENNENFTGWSFIQSLTTPQTNPEKVYVHPVAKRTSNALSKQSLDMCTESLGSETGTHEFSSLPLTREGDQSLSPSSPKRYAKKLLRGRSFPPPLSSSHSVQVRLHREKGRLVIKAITKTSPNNYFQTERKNGRLTLSLIKGKLYTDDEKARDGSDNNRNVEGKDANSGKVGGGIENRVNMCKEEESGKSGISNWGKFLVATS